MKANFASIRSCLGLVRRSKIDTNAGWSIAENTVCAVRSLGLETSLMRYLPLVMARGPLLAELVRDAYQDPRRRRLCACCGAPMLIRPDRTEQTVRCPACSRLQHVTLREEAPWRLTAASAEALRRTASWLRRV
jgi:DNA-directed RNA polymerase subunit RPC12/RpoP